MTKDKGNRRATVGPATEYIAGELRAQRGRLGWTMEDVADNTGVSKSTAARAMTGETSIPTEILVLLANGMDMDIGKLTTEASKFVD